MDTNTTERDVTRRSSRGRGSRSPDAIGWVSLAFSVLWIFGIGSLLGVVLGTWSVVSARRAGLRTPTVAVVAITIGALSLVLGLLSAGIVGGLEPMNPGETSGSGPAEAG